MKLKDALARLLEYRDTEEAYYASQSIDDLSYTSTEWKLQYPDFWVTYRNDENETRTNLGWYRHRLEWLKKIGVYDGPTELTRVK